jgi:tetratricopeptide (TPR) repeat protein
MLLGQAVTHARLDRDRFAEEVESELVDGSHLEGAAVHEARTSGANVYEPGLVALVAHPHLLRGLAPQYSADCVILAFRPEGTLIEMKGAFSEGVLPGILRDLYLGRMSGTLRCTSGEERRNIRFKRGHIVRADTNVQGKQLGEVLVEQSWISAAQLEQATATATGKRLGEVLIEMGALKGDKLEDALALHVQHIVAQVFKWTDGQYEFEEEPESADQSELTLKLSTGELILEAVRQVSDPDVVRYALGDMDRILALSSDPMLRFQKIALSPTDGFVLSRVDGSSSAREVVQMIPLGTEETLKSLFGLLCTGIIEYGANAPKKSATAGPALAVGRKATPRTSPEAAARAAPPSPANTSPSVPVRSPAMDSRRQEIVDAFDGLKTRDYFEILSLPRTATEQQVKEAYFGLAKRFHPDAHHDGTLSDLADKLEAVFIRLGEAYETLKNPRIRADYEGRLARHRPGEQSGTSAPPSAAAPGERPASDPAADRKAAEDAVRRGAWLYEKEKYWDAIQTLEPALEFLQGKVLHRARVVLAKAYMKNPKWLKRGEETLQAVTLDDPQNVEAFFLLGTIYRDRGLKSRATTMFRKVLELKPDHEEALVEVGPLAPTEPEAAQGSGLLGKLFRKG